MKTQFEQDYQEPPWKYKNNKWRNLKKKADWRIRLEIMEEFLKKDTLIEVSGDLLIKSIE